MKNVDIKKSHVFASLVVVFLMIAIALNPKSSMQSMLNGLLIWLNSIVPALFPFLFLTKLLTNLKLVEVVAKKLEKVTKKLFNVSGICSYVFLMSLLSGYPIGAKLTSELFCAGKITQAEATRMNSFCSTSGPLFVVGTVGTTLLGSYVLGIVVLISHILGAILNGICFRFFGKKEKVEVSTVPLAKKPVDGILAETMYDSIVSILVVGGFVSMFFVVVDLLFHFGILTFFANILANILSIFGINSSLSTGLVSGFFEVTRGCRDLSSSQANLISLTVCASFLISFGGLSIHLQSLAFLQKCKTKIGLYFLMKTTQSVFSAIFAFVLAILVF